MTDPNPGRDLHSLLEDAVSDVEPRLGLADIQDRTAAQRPTRRPWVWGTLAAVAATAATVAAVTVVTDRSPQQRSDDPPAASQSPDATPPEPTQTPDAPGGDLLPVYYVGDAPSGTRLFREFVKDPNPGDDTALDRMSTALDLAMYGDAVDPDYRSGWPDSTNPEAPQVLNVSLTPEAIEIAIDDSGEGPYDLRQRPEGMSQGEARLALQQLVYTAQAVLQERLPVIFTIGGDHTVSLLGVPVGTPMTNDPEMDVLGTVWIIDPAEGATVGSTFTVTGRGAFFEATVNWQLLQGERRRQGGLHQRSRGHDPVSVRAHDQGRRPRRLHPPRLRGRHVRRRGPR